MVSMADLLARIEELERRLGTLEDQSACQHEWHQCNGDGDEACLKCDAWRRHP